MGKVPMYPKEELQELQRLKQSDRQKFDAEPRNEERLVFIRDRLKHNWERSQEMLETIKQIGWGDSVEVVDKIIAHLLSVGVGVTVETRVRHSSQLEAPLGGLKVQSTSIVKERLRELDHSTKLPEAEVRDRFLDIYGASEKNYISIV